MIRNLLKIIQFIKVKAIIALSKIAKSQLIFKKIQHYHIKLKYLFVIQYIIQLIIQLIIIQNVIHLKTTQIVTKHKIIYLITKNY